MRNPEKRSIAVIAGVIAAAVVLTAVLKPRYDDFVFHDRADTCYGAMYWLGIWYHAALLDAQEQGIALDQIDDEELIRKIAETNYDVVLDDDLSTDDLCHAGGHVQVILDSERHKISVSCDADGHIWYNDDAVTKEMLEGVENSDSGVDVTTCLR